MKEERIVGNNIRILMNESQKSMESAASSLGYSIDDLIRICEGQIYLSPDDIRAIADFFNVSQDELLSEKTDEEYVKAGCIHYNHPFKDSENLNKIMDIFDLICEIEEVL